MGDKIFPTRALFWSFWANSFFLFGMIGYFLMDGFEYMHPNTLNASLSSMIYVILAGVFVIDTTLELFTVYNADRNSYQYVAMVFSCIFDELGSHAYFLGALFAMTSLASLETAATLTRLGAYGFAIGAAANMFVTGSTVSYTWANILNLLGALFYVAAILITKIQIAQIIVLIGDFIYVIDAILYTVCWLSDRRSSLTEGEQDSLIKE